eukprot:m.285322 g.285322  ORF g.285322 m.285322 type:complete len:60 (-) comp16204_c0_seq1:63-242(-)
MVQYAGHVLSPTLANTLLAHQVEETPAPVNSNVVKTQSSIHKTLLNQEERTRTHVSMRF